MNRLDPRRSEVEIGLADALARHPTVHLATDHVVPPVRRWQIALEQKRPQLLRDMGAEMLGVFAYTYCGVSALASFTLTTAAGVNGFGSLLEAAFGFAFGIAFALIIGATTSGGHFNPAIVFATFNGFPLRKVPFYIFAQILGAFLASLVIYCQWYEGITALTEGLRAAGESPATATGPAGIFVALPLANQTKRWLFANEFFADFFIGIVIWAAIDPNNIFMTPASVPFVIGLAYFCMIGGFGANTLATNLAKDLGCRCMAAIFFGKEVFTIKSGFAAISILTNIPATFLGVMTYMLFCGDHRKLMRDGHALPAEIHSELQRERRTTTTEGEKGPLETYLRKHPTVREEYGKEGFANGTNSHAGYASAAKMA